MIVGKTFCKVPVFHYNSLHLRLLDGVFLPPAIFALIRIGDIPLSFTNTGEEARHKKCRICTFIVSSQFPHSISYILQVVYTHFLCGVFISRSVVVKNWTNSNSLSNK